MDATTNGAAQTKVDEEQARRAKRAALKELNIAEAGKGALSFNCLRDRQKLVVLKVIIMRNQVRNAASRV